MDVRYALQGILPKVYAAIVKIARNVYLKRKGIALNALHAHI